MIEETIGWKVDGKFFDNKQRAKEYEAKIWFINEIYDLGFDKDISEEIYNEIGYIQKVIAIYNDKIKGDEINGK